MDQKTRSDPTARPREADPTARLREADPTSLLREADRAARAGRLDEARSRWERVVATVDHPVALNGLGMIAMREGRPADAAAYLLRSAEADPGQAVLWLNHAAAARACGDDAAERSSLERARALDPLAIAVSLRLADLAERSGDAVAAGTHWAAAVSLAEQSAALPPDVGAAVARGRAYLKRQADALGREVDGALAARRAAVPPAARRRVDAAFDHAVGRRTIYLNQCSGLHVPFLPADEYFDRALFDWFPVLEAGTAAIRAELRGALSGGRDGFEPYVALPAGTPRNVWTALDGSMDWNTLHLWRHGARDEAACARFPRTAAIVDRLPLARIAGRMPTVFFSTLAPRAHIPPHTGVTNARAIVHLPLIVPDGCRFRVGGETRPWVEGEAFAFDDTIEHEAWNESDAPRTVLILDVWNPHLTAIERGMIEGFYGAELPAAHQIAD